MAVVAMDQYATLMTGLNLDLVMAASELQIAEHGCQHRAIVWKPSPMVLADKDLPMNWDLTSDSLAAWLATKLNAKHLLVVKSIPMNGAETVDIKDLIFEGAVDAYFGEYIARKKEDHEESKMNERKEKQIMRDNIKKNESKFGSKPITPLALRNKRKLMATHQESQMSTPTKFRNSKLLKTDLTCTPGTLLGHL
jgi:hypothetical protein